MNQEHPDNEKASNKEIEMASILFILSAFSNQALLSTLSTYTHPFFAVCVVTASIITGSAVIHVSSGINAY
jgi:hypothetical protein